MSSRTEAAREAPAPKPAALWDRPWAVGVYLGFTALVGLAFAAPLASALGAAVGSYPRGDGELFDRGGVMLLEAIRSLQTQLPAIGAAWIVISVAALPASLVVIAFCLAIVGAPDEPRPSDALAKAVRAFPALVLLGLVSLVAAALVLALVMLGGGSIVRSIWPVAPARDVARWGLTALALVLLAVWGIFHDLARAAAVTRSASVLSSLRAAFRAVRRRPARALGSYALRALLGAGAVTASAWLGVAIGEGAPGAVLAMAVVHQLGLAAAGLFRLSWLSQAAHLVASDAQSGSPPGPDAGAATAPEDEPLHKPLA